MPILQGTDGNSSEWVNILDPDTAATIKRQRDLQHRFTYHPPKDGQKERYTEIRDVAYNLALILLKLTPTSREQSLAFTALEECVMWANASIARNE